MKKALGLIETRGLAAAIAAADQALKSGDVILEGKKTTGPGFVTIMFSGSLDEIQKAVSAGAKAARNAGELISSTVIAEPDSQLALLLPITKTLVAADTAEKPIIKKRSEIAEAKVSDTKEPVIKEPAAGEILLMAEEKAEASKVKQKVPVDKPVPSIKQFTAIKKTVKQKMQKIKEPAKTFSTHKHFETSSETIDRLRREALGKSYSPRSFRNSKPVEVNEEVTEDIDNMNVHKLRKLARNTPGFPIIGRKISKASRSELLKLFNGLNS